MSTEEPLNGGQPADDRSDRAVLAGRLACFREAPGIFALLGSVAFPAGARRTGSSWDDLNLVGSSTR